MFTSLFLKKQKVKTREFKIIPWINNQFLKNLTYNINKQLTISALYYGLHSIFSFDMFVLESSYV